MNSICFGEEEDGLRAISNARNNCRCYARKAIKKKNIVSLIEPSEGRFFSFISVLASWTTCTYSVTTLWQNDVYIFFLYIRVPLTFSSRRALFSLHASLLLYCCASNNSQSLSLLALSPRGFTIDIYFVHVPFSSTRFVPEANVIFIAHRDKDSSWDRDINSRLWITDQHEPINFESERELLVRSIPQMYLTKVSKLKTS